MEGVRTILKRYWGYDSFRPLQEEIIQSVLDGKDTLALLPTGGGKSICFQVPAMCLNGVCIVISPLISLMKDQVEQLKKRGIKAAAIYSGMSRKEIDVVLDNCIYGQVKFLYVSPERIKTDLFLERARQMTLSMAAIDEAHCVSQWGYDFRPSYLEIGVFLETFKISRKVALTASATAKVKDDIIEKLGLVNVEIFRQSFARKNLSYSVFELERKDHKMLEILRNVPGSSVIYVRSRKQTKEIADFLNRQQLQADYYHAGLSGADRFRKQDLWTQGETRIMVATNAFGMGIDKPDVRSVIHFDLPDSLESYYQEAGRAGRDGRKAYAVQLFHQQDIINLKSRIERSAVTVGFMKRVYQALANYYKLAVGSNVYAAFDFDYQSFTQRFDLPVVETYYALNKLEEEGLIQLNEAVRGLSRIMFLLPQGQVYRYQVANRNMDLVIKTLMRLYGGELFSDYVSIKESDIASLLKVSGGEAVKHMQFLHQAEVIDYRRNIGNPQLVFLTHRYDVSRLPINKERIEWRRKVVLDKIASVEDYVLNKQKCRSIFIQNYFDEDTNERCGVCDVCLEKLKHSDGMLDDILDYINKGPRSEQELLRKFNKLKKENLITGLRTLMDRGEISLYPDDKFRKL